MWQGDQRRREAVVLAGGAGVTRRLSHPPATRTAFEVALSSVDRHTGVTTPSPPPAAARRPAAPRPGRPRACGPGRRGSRPSRHQPPAALEQVGPRIGGLDRVPDRVAQRRLDHLPRVVGFILRPVAEARPEPVRHRREPQLLQQAREGHVLQLHPARRRERQRPAGEHRAAHRHGGTRVLALIEQCVLRQPAQIQQRKHLGQLEATAACTAAGSGR